MTVKEKISNVVFCGEYDMEVDDWRKLVAMAYYMGRESAAKELGDQFVNFISEQRHRASECRYPHMANKIIGEKHFFYHPDYSGAMTATFGNDETKM